MVSQNTNQLSSKLARCRRVSWYVLGFGASAVFLGVMIWILWFYLGVSSLPATEPQRRAIVHYGTTNTKPPEVTPSTPLDALISKDVTLSGSVQTTSKPLRGNSRGEAQLSVDKRRDYQTARSGDGFAKGDFEARDKISSTNSSSRGQEDSRSSDSKSSIINSGSDGTRNRDFTDDDDKRRAPSKEDTESITVRIISASAPENRKLLDDRRTTEDKSIEKSKRIDDIDIDDKERPRRPVVRDERRPIREDDDAYYDKDRPSSRYPERDVDKRPVDELPRRRYEDDRPVSRGYDRDIRIYDKDRDDYPRRRYDDDDRRDYDRPRKGDDEDLRIRERERTTILRPITSDVSDRDSDDRYKDDRYKDDRYRDDPYREERYRSRPSDDKYRDTDDRYRSRVDDDRYVSRKADDSRDDRYRSSEDDYRRDDRYKDRPIEDKYKDSDRYRDRPLTDDEYRRRDDRYRDVDDDRYRSRVEASAPLRPSETLRSRSEERRYSPDTEVAPLKPTVELSSSRSRDFDDRRDRTSYRDDVRVEATRRASTDTADYRSRDRIRAREDDYRGKESIVPSRRDDDYREGSSRTRIREDPRYDDTDRKRTRTRGERYDDDDRYRRDPLPKREDYSVSKGDDRALDKDRPVYLVEDKLLSKSLRGDSDDVAVDKRSYVTSVDDYAKNRPRTDSRPLDDDYRPPRRRYEDDDRIPRDDRYEERRRDRPDYDDSYRNSPKGEYSRERTRDRDYDEDDRRYPRRELRPDDKYPIDRDDARGRENRTDDRSRNRRVEPTRAYDLDPPARSASLVRASSDTYYTEARYYEDDLRRPPRRIEEEYPKRDSRERDETRIYSSRGESRSSTRESGSEVVRTPCSKSRNSYTDMPEGLSFRRVGDPDDCDDMNTNRRPPMSSGRVYESGRGKSMEALSPKEIIEAAYRHTEGENRAREAVYPVFNPRANNMTSEIIRPSERRGTTITARKKRSPTKRRKSSKIIIIKKRKHG